MAKTALDLFVDGLLEQAPEGQYSPWLCPHCSQPAEIEDVTPSLDGTRTLTLWHCEPCQTWGVTPSPLREPPVWVSKKQQ